MRISKLSLVKKAIILPINIQKTNSPVPVFHNTSVLYQGFDASILQCYIRFYSVSLFLRKFISIYICTVLRIIMNTGILSLRNLLFEISQYKKENKN